MDGATGKIRDLLFVPGLRVDYLDAFGAIQPVLRWQTTKQLALKAGYGLYAKHPRATNIMRASETKYRLAGTWQGRQYQLTYSLELDSSIFQRFR